MGTTTIRLSDELKARVAAAAKREGTSANNFIVEAIAEKADADERRAEFHALANRRWQRILETGETVPWEEFRHYLMDRIHGKDTPRPAPRKFRK